MRILHINDTYAMTGGISRYLFEIMELLERQGHTNAVIYQKPHPQTITDARNTYFVPMGQGESGESFVRTHEIVRAENPDLIYLHAVYDPAVVRAATALAPTAAYIHGFHTVCPALGKYFHRGDAVCQRPYGLGCVPLIYIRRCSDARHPRTLESLMHTTAQQKQAYQSVSLLLVASVYMRDLLRQNGFTSGKIQILPYPHTPVRSEPINSSSPLRLLYAGRLEIEKGIPYLLKAFARLSTPCELHIAGDGTLRSVYERLAADLGISARVRFLGWLDDQHLDEEYNAARAIIMPSVFPEPFGQVGVQALLRERPVVAFNVGGIPDWLKNGEHGYLVSPRDINGLVQCIERLLNDATLAARLGAQGRAFALGAYMPQDHVSKLLKLFNGVVATK